MKLNFIAILLVITITSCNENSKNTNDGKNISSKKSILDQEDWSGTYISNEGGSDFTLTLRKDTENNYQVEIKSRIKGIEEGSEGETNIIKSEGKYDNSEITFSIDSIYKDMGEYNNIEVFKTCFGKIGFLKTISKPEGDINYAALSFSNCSSEITASKAPRLKRITTFTVFNGIPIEVTSQKNTSLQIRKDDYSYEVIETYPKINKGDKILVHAISSGYMAFVSFFHNGDEYSGEVEMDAIYKN